MRKISYIFGIAAALLVGCNTETGETTMEEIVQTENMETMETNENLDRPLEAALTEKKDGFSLKASDEKKAIYADGLQSVVDQGATSNALQVGETAIDFTLTNALGNEVSLYKELENGPVILMWYRGGWCPYCNLTLHQMQESLPEFKAAGAQLLALTPELPDSTFSTQERHAIEFEVLSDMDSKVAKQYKVVFKLTDEVRDIYENNFGLSDYNGNDSGELPLAATYIIGQDKVIKYAFLDADYRNRAEPADILEELQKLH